MRSVNRRAGQAFTIGRGITVHVRHVGAGQVRLSVQAPGHLSVRRLEDLEQPPRAVPRREKSVEQRLGEALAALEPATELPA